MHILRTSMRQQLSIYKFKKIATESFKNGLRLHFDSILLYKNHSYPSAFLLSVLALEEFSKSYWVEHYYYSAKTNKSFPDKEFEQAWLNLLYHHPKKQKAFFGWGISRDYSSKFIKLVESGNLESKKQKATYVGLRKKGNFIDINGRISLPLKIIDIDAKQLISLINDYLKDISELKVFQGFYFDIHEKDELLSDKLYIHLKQWRHRSGLKNGPSVKTRIKKQNRTNRTSK